VDGKRVSLPSLGLRVSERRMLLGTVDVLLLWAALAAALLLTTELVPDWAALTASWKWYVTLTAVWVMYATLFDAYNLARAASTVYSARAVASAAVLTSLTYLAIPWLTPTLVNRSYGFAFVLLAVFSVLIWRLAYAQLFTQPTFQRRSLIVGTGRQGRTLAPALRSRFALEDANPFRGTGNVPLGFVTIAEQPCEGAVVGLPVLGDAHDLIRLIRELAVDEVILALPRETPIGRPLYEAILDCRELGIHLTEMTTVYERLTGRVPVEFASWNLGTAASGDDGAFRRIYDMLKRLTDGLVGLAGLLVMGLLILPISLGNALTSPGPLFYRQQRVGKGGCPFRILKFRSMRIDAEQEGGATWAQSDDDRVTPIGKWLRRLHLDELPQVVNILRGEMSVVGPRPERPEFVGLLAREIPFYRARNSVRPGLTGWAQIHQDYGSSVDDAKVKLEYDLYYVKNFSLWLDVVIMLRTVTKVVGLQGR
jgi:exopolysaccharide biosynthesis polyprenyl glycosylphosphotransferase